MQNARLISHFSWRAHPAGTVQERALTKPAVCTDAREIREAQQDDRHHEQMAQAFENQSPCLPNFLPSTNFKNNARLAEPGAHTCESF